MQEGLSSVFKLVCITTGHASPSPNGKGSSLDRPALNFCLQPDISVSRNMSEVMRQEEFCVQRDDVSTVVCKGSFQC